MACFTATSATLVWDRPKSSVTPVAIKKSLSARNSRKAARTGGNQLSLMAEYPEYKFLHSQPHLYWMIQTHYPELYQRVKAAVANGQFVVEGGTWVEPDTNVPSGESLIRQFVHGKRFFQDEFGVESELL